MTPQIFRYGAASSSLDVAFELIHEGRLSEWDSVFVKEQTAGRGQMRRSWISPEGNIYAAMRLPAAGHFNSPAASVIVGAFCCLALRDMGYSVLIKWPNDLILARNGAPAKIGGILLEERSGALVAGIGINVVSFPDSGLLRDGAQIQAGSIAGARNGEMAPWPEELWKNIALNMFARYTDKPSLDWKNIVEGMLLWRGRQVEIVDGNESVKGRLLGIGQGGGALLATEGGTLEVLNGGMRL